jgi:uncharacterized protein YndB with AHSA1/START domain
MSRGAFGRVTPDAVREATGRDPQAWFAALDAVGASRWRHDQIIAHLARAEGLTSDWWRQAVAVSYEQARGARVVGQTADVGFQIGVQLTVQAGVAEAWELLVTEPELWLGSGAAVDFERGRRYELPVGPDGTNEPGASGEIRAIRAGYRLRMTWQPADWPAPATLQLTLLESRSGNTALHAHLERLPDAQTREAMRAHWRAMLERIAAEFE